MSKIKKLLDENADFTDPRESQATSEPTITDEFTANDHYYLELINSINNLQVLKPYQYLDEIKYCKYLLEQLINEMEKPF